MLFVLSGRPDAYAALVIGGVFTALGAWLLWNSTLAPIRIGRRRTPIPAGTGDVPYTLYGLLTPSEIVTVNAGYFAPRTLGRNVSLFDGQPDVSAEDLVQAQLKA